MPRTPRPSTAMSIGLCVLALALALASCGSGDDETAAPTTTPVTTTAPIPTPTVSPTEAPVATSTPAPTATAAPTPSEDPTATPDPTSSPVATTTPAPDATATATPTPTVEPTTTPGPTPSATATATPTPPPTGVITAAIGEDFFVSFELDATTNFRWQLDELPEGSLLTLIDEIYIAPGGGTTQDTGWQHFVFRGNSDGQATLTFWYVRPNGAPMETVHYSVIIGSGSPVCSEVFNVAVGEEFEIVLQSNSSTGFRWELSEPPTDDIVTLVKNEYIAASTSAVGASGWQKFTFRGAKNGETDLNFWYVRPFDDPPAPANVANYKAVVGTGVPGCSAIFTIDIDEDFDISLAADPSTGYRWQLSEAPVPGVVTLIKDEFIPSDASSTGTIGVQRLTFRGTTDGETALKLWYVRPFDDPLTPVDRIAFMVIVSG